MCGHLPDASGTARNLLADYPANINAAPIGVDVVSSEAVA